MKISLFLLGLLAQFGPILGTSTEDSVDLMQEGNSRCTFHPTKPRGHKVVCGVSGSLGNPKPLGSPITVGSPNLCRNACFRNHGCVSFGFNQDTSSCQLYSAYIIKQKFQRSSSSPTVFYNRKCFKRTCVHHVCNNQGIEYAIYHNQQGNNVNDNYTSDFDPSVYKGQLPEYNSTTSSVGGFQINDPSNQPVPITVYGSSFSFPCNYFVLNHRAYFLPTTSGTYTITFTYTDEIVFFWIGSNAYSGWTSQNANYIAPYGQFTYTFGMNAGTYYPFRILYANAQGSANLQISVTDPNHNVILDSHTQPSNQIVQYGCKGSDAPAFPPFGSES